MTLDDGQQLRARLGSALEQITPSPAPVSSVVRRGKLIRMQRWTAAAAVLAVVAVLGAVGPTVLHHALAPAASATYRVTVRPPGPGSPAGLIASGAINGRPWKLIAHPPARNGTQCFDTGSGDPCPVSTPVPLPGGDPAGIVAAEPGNGLQYEYGTVRPEVGYLRVVLGNGTVLVLHPVAMYHRRYVAFAVPAHLPVSEVIGYSRQRSELAYAIPFRDDILRWLRPGERVQPRLTIKIGSGVADGAPWSEFAYVGPWGRCFSGAGGGGDCIPSFGPLLSRGHLVQEMIASAGPGSGKDQVWYYLGTAARSVGYLQLLLFDGSTVRVQTYGVLGQRFFAFAATQSSTVLQWTAYSASGSEIANGLGGFTTH